MLVFSALVSYISHDIKDNIEKMMGKRRFKCALIQIGGHLLRMLSHTRPCLLVFFLPLQVYLREMTAGDYVHFVVFLLLQ